VRLMNPKQYALVDLDTGKIKPIDAPLGQILVYTGPEKAIWLGDGQSVILVNTYLPVEDTTGSEREQRLQKPCVAFFGKVSNHLTCIATIKQSSRDESTKSGTFFFLGDAFWDGATKDLVLSYETIGNENDPAPYEHKPEVYRQENDRWILKHTPAR